MTKCQLDSYYTEEEISEFLNKTISSLRTDACRRRGPPRTKIGKRILYHRNSFSIWLDAHEINYDELGDRE